MDTDDMNQWPRGHFSGKARTEMEIFNELDGHFYSLDPERLAVKDAWREPFATYVPPLKARPNLQSRRPGWWHSDMLPKLKEMLNDGYPREEIAKTLGIKVQAVYHQEQRLILIAEGKLNPRGPA